MAAAVADDFAVKLNNERETLSRLLYEKMVDTLLLVSWYIIYEPIISPV